MAMGLCLGLWISVGACQAPPGSTARPGEPPRRSAAERAYHAPPRVLSIRPEVGGLMLIEGLASAGAKVRLASPKGAAILTTADRDGKWRVSLSRSSEVRLLGLSMSEAGRVIQSEGYLAISPTGLAAQLRAGAGASVFINRLAGLRLLAVDYDRKGAAVVSGTGPGATPVTVFVDGVRRDQTTTDSRGRFTVALDEPLSPGVHELGVSGAGLQHGVSVPVTSLALPPVSFDGEQIALGWRIDWVTPGGGVQTTILADPAAPTR